jgi:transcription elongation factor Elf1
MPLFESSSSLTAFSAADATIGHCPNCGSNQVMHVREIYPSLFQGQDVALVQCSTCGSQRTGFVGI